MSNHLSLQVGLFRKSGVKSRIQALRQMNESCGAGGGGVNYEGQSAYDVADMLKQYFRDLPEPLLTSKLSDTFLQIYQCKNMHRIHFHFLQCFVENHTLALTYAWTKCTHKHWYLVFLNKNSNIKRTRHFISRGQLTTTQRLYYTVDACSWMGEEI